MIEKRLVQWYAADAGVDLDIAEREIALVYVLCILADHGLLERLAFKGGTAIRKIYLGSQGRFSLDLDFTATQDTDPEALILDVAGLFHNQSHHGLTFIIPAGDYYANPESCGAEISYQHEWSASGKFGIQVSFRGRPLLPVRSAALRHERYFEWLGVKPPATPSLDLHEIIGEKIRAASQRSRVRDLYDLYQLASLRFDRARMRRIAVLKCWETNFAFDPAAFLTGVDAGQYDWADLRRLLHKGREVQPAVIMRGVRENYAFLSELSPDEALLAGDPYQRQKKIYQALCADIQFVE
ncbi:MAG: nucleotidyl transferase AbiEii/AbiGii toxin family protein [Anaerolineales bacterium]|nr:nucleotidyl transferase AbiEii/AbiGii toxin family protein [Anaerolineales bacterium]